MFDIAGAVGAGLSGVASIFGGISASKAMKKVKKNLQERQTENTNWFNRKYNEDFTQRADAQRILEQTRQQMLNNTRRSEGAQAVMGGTDESVAAQKEANAAALADAMSKMQVASDARKDTIEAQYQQKADQLSDQLNDMEINKAKNVTNAIQGVADAGAGIAAAFSPTENK